MRLFARAGEGGAGRTTGAGRADGATVEAAASGTPATPVEG